MRWSSSANTLYVKGQVTCDLTAVSTVAPSTALERVGSQNAIWYLKANVKLEQGATLDLHGTAIGGDVNELRLRSNNSTASNSIIQVRAEWGEIDIANTKITSWDDAAGGPDTEHATYKRSYIRAKSYLDSDGVTPRESRMDIVNSEISYLGHYGGEAYGLAWKVNGSTPGIYDLVDVFGDVTNNYIHHNYMGIYTFGAYGMVFLDNEVADNASYGLDYHDDSDSLVISGNLSRNNGNHGIICSKRCDHLTITNNESRNNVGHGIMLHRLTNETLVENNVVSGNTDTGLAVMDSHDNVLRGNTVSGNKYGIRLSVGSQNNLIENNDVGGSTSYGLYFYKGSDAPTSGDGRPKFNTYRNNTVHDSASYGMKLSDADDNTFQGNNFVNNAGKLVLERSQRNRFENNSIPVNRAIQTKGSSTAVGSTFIRTTTHTLVEVDSYSSATFEDPAGRVFDPEEPAGQANITPAGSSMTLNYATIGSKSLVTARNLWATVSGGGVAISGVTWAGASGTKSWSNQATSGSQLVNYAVGDLTPGASYRVRKNGSTLSVLVADSGGRISFGDVLGTTGSVTYSVQPN